MSGSGIEIEAKMSLADPDALKARLVALGAKAGAPILETNTFFDTPGSTLKSGDRGLRLRVEQEIGNGIVHVCITHKGPRAHGKLKSRSETEVTVASARDAAKLLVALGFVPVFSFEKVREPWELDGCKIALDTLPQLGHFVEIEGPTEEQVLAMRQRLGMENLTLNLASYIAILQTHLLERHIHTEHVRFDKPPEIKREKVVV